jgi:hypothetical protein
MLEMLQLQHRCFVTFITIGRFKVRRSRVGLPLASPYSLIDSVFDLLIERVTFWATIL